MLPGDQDPHVSTDGAALKADASLGLTAKGSEGAEVGDGLAEQRQQNEADGNVLALEARVAQLQAALQAELQAAQHEREAAAERAKELEAAHEATRDDVAALTTELADARALADVCASDRARLEALQVHHGYNPMYSCVRLSVYEADLQSIRWPCLFVEQSCPHTGHAAAINAEFAVYVLLCAVCSTSACFAT